MANLAHGAVAIVGGDLRQQRDSAGAVAFENEFFVGESRQFTGATLDGTLDVVGRHVLRFGRQDGGAQSGVHVGVATVFSGHGDFLNQTRETLSPLGVKRAFFMLDCGPFGMARHEDTSV